MCKTPNFSAESDMDFGIITENEFVFQFHQVVVRGRSSLVVRCIEVNELAVVGQELPSMAKGMGGWVVR